MKNYLDKVTKLIAVLFFISFNAIGQNQITGRIIDRDTKKPIKEASISVMLKDIKSKSNFLGYFQITANPVDSLIITKPFYETGIVKVPAATGIQIQITKRKHSDYDGGMKNFFKFLARNLKYPAKASRNKTQGRIYVSFTIDSLGLMSNFKTIKDIGNGCSSAVTEALKKVPNYWVPSETITTFILPVSFILVDSKIELEEIKSPQSVELPQGVELPHGVLLSEIVVSALFNLDR